MELTISVLIFIASLVYVFFPLFNKKKDETQFDNASRIREGLIHDKEAIYQHILELDFDHELGNIDDTDYEKARDDLKKQAARVISAINQTSEAAERSAGKSASAANSSAKAVHCVSCSEVLASNDVFCPYCGQKQN